MITCQHYDYIEIACMYKFPVLLTLKDGTTLEGIAQDTKMDEDHKECILLKTEDENEMVILEELAKMEVQIDNPHFKSVRFT